MIGRGFIMNIRIVISFGLSISFGLLIPLGAFGQDQPFPYADGWSVQHHDQHNSDWIGARMNDFVPTNQIRVIHWELRETNNPTVEIGGVTVTGKGTNTIIYVPTGKVTYPNLWAIRMEDGSLYWNTPASTNEIDPGPNSALLSMPPAIDKNGRLYLADSHYVYCYSAFPNLNAEGKQQWIWRRIMPNLRRYDYNDGRWYRTQNPDSNDVVFARPFLSFQFTPMLNQTSYLAGITVDGEVYVFNPSNAQLYAEAYLETNILTEVNTNEPCDPFQFALEDDPMNWPADGKIKMGVWTTGSNTDDPDLDYFMNPCQLDAIINAGTFGEGTMIANNLCIAKDTNSDHIARIFICGTASERLKNRHPLHDDGYIYRIDFDPTQDYSNRLLIMNYSMTNIIGIPTPRFAGRMIDGEGSASSPDLSENGRWLLSGDNTTNFYCFNTDDGSVAWVQGIGAALGSPTTFQNPDANGNFLEISFGDYDPWFMLINENTGEIETNPVTGEPYIRAVHFSELITNNYWRTDDPGYSNTFTNILGDAYTRIAIGASVIVGTSNKVIMVYTVGWHNPLDAKGFLFTIPTHSVVLVVDLEDIWTATNIADLIDAAYIDTNGTSEVGLIPAPDLHNRALLIYGSQSASMAQFLDYNNRMPEGMKPLYVRPYGGFSILELPFLDVSTVTPPELLKLVITNQVPEVTWSSVTGIHYAVDMRDDLQDASWTTMYEHKAMRNNQSALDSEANTATARFYRVRIEP